MYNLEYFKDKEFTCKCCKTAKMNPEFLEILDHLRSKLGFPLKITSAWRCKSHNNEVGGRSKSSHLYGLAVDIDTNCLTSEQLYSLLHMAFKFKFFIGIGKDFIHLDKRDYVDEQECGHNKAWVY